MNELYCPIQVEIDRSEVILFLSIFTRWNDFYTNRTTPFHSCSISNLTFSPGPTGQVPAQARAYMLGEVGNMCRIQ